MSEQSSDRRHSRRAALKLRGRYMLADGYESHCETIDVSATGMRIHAEVVADVGERVVAYIDELGRAEGQTARRGADWFAIEAHTTQARIDRVAKKIASLAGQDAEDVIAAPIVPRRRAVTLQLAFGQVYTVEVSEETSLGAKVHANFRLLRGAKMTIDGHAAVVDRDDSDGFFVVYRRPARRP